MEPLSCLSFSARRPVHILIVDDSSRVRQDLRLLLELDDRLRVVGEAANGSDAIAQVEDLQPEVVLMDLAMPAMDGYQATHQIKARWPTCRVIAFSVHSYPQARQKAVDAGADGFIEKGASLGEIVRKISAS